MAGKSGPLLLLDGLNAFILFPFRNFFLRLRTVWFTLTHISKRERARPGTVILTAGALLAALLLFTASAGLLISADAGFAALMSGFESLFRFRLDDDALFTLLISLPIGAYLFGLIAGSAGRMKPAFAGGVKPFIRAWPCCAGCRTASGLASQGFSACCIWPFSSCRPGIFLAPLPARCPMALSSPSMPGRDF